MSGSWSEQAEDSYKSEVQWMFSKNEIEKLRKPSGTDNVVSKRFADGTFEILIQPDEPTFKKPFVLISAIPQYDDARLATSTQAWVRLGTYTFEFKIFYISKKKGTQEIHHSLFKYNFSSSKPRVSRSCEKSLEDLLRFHDLHKSLGIQLTITSQHRPLPTPPSSKLLLSFFDNPATADIAFGFHLDKSEPSHVLACKSLLSAASARFEVLLKTFTLKQEMSKLSLLENNDSRLDREIVERELAPFFKLQPGDVAGGGVDGKLNEPDVAVEKKEERPKKKIKLEEFPGDELDDSGQRVDVVEEEKVRIIPIDVSENDFCTFKVMIAYLHVQIVSFYSITSNFLVECDKQNNEFKKYEHHLELWLEDQFNARNQITVDGVGPCSPYEMYRLAGKYELEDLKKLSLDYIVRSLNPENVAYELFNPLSLESKPVQEAILDYFVGNWSEVKKTKAFKVVLDKFSSGQLAKGRDLMEKIFDLMKA